MKGESLKETVILCQWGYYKIILIYQISHRKEFQALALPHSLWQRANAYSISFRNSLQWPIYITCDQIS